MPGHGERVGVTGEEVGRRAGAQGAREADAQVRGTAGHGSTVTGAGELTAYAV